MRRLLVSLAALLLFSVSSFAYVTLTPSSYTVNVGEELYLNVPSATVGYIDKAVWACSNSNIAFVQKDDAGAIVKANAYFSGAAIVELVCVEKYVDEKGYTRAVTYYKEFRITCAGSSSGGGQLTSISFPTQNLKVGDIVYVNPTVQPAGAEVNYASWSMLDGVADVASIFIWDNKVKVIAGSPGTEKAIITTVEGKSAIVTVNVSAPSSPSKIVGTDGNTLDDPNLFDAVKRMESLFNKSLEFKNK